MTISIAIIMKDEARIIGRCLTCVSMLADEVVVVDTGSIDHSRELAKKFPKVKLFDSELFNKDTHYSDFEFGKAKNEAIRRCTGDFVLWWDADDVISRSSILKIQEIAKNEKRACLYAFQVLSGTMRFEHVRMFTNGKGILFDENHACHEFLNTNNHPLILRPDIEIQHLPEQRAVSSQERNLAIMEKDFYVRKHDDQRTLFYLANAYRESCQLLKAADFYDKYLAVSQWREERFFARYYKGQCLFRSGKTDDGRDEVLRALGEDYRFAEAFCFLGDVEMSKANWEKAILWFKMAMATPIPKDARLFVAEESYSRYPTIKIGECVARLGPGESSASHPAPKKEIYELPADRGLAMLAAASLSNITTVGKAAISVVPLDEWQKSMVEGFETMNITQGKGKRLSLPLNLKGIHAQEWYAKSAGHLGVSQRPVHVVKQDERSRKHVIVTPDVTLPEIVVKKIQQAEKSVLLLDPACKFIEAKIAFRDGAAYIGAAGWLQHLAKWTNVPAFVFFDGRSPKEFGWDDQENHSEGDFSDVEKFLDRSLS